MPAPHTGPTVRFCSTVMCGNRLNCWNTMPTRRFTARRAARVIAFASTLTPQTSRCPCSNGSSRLTVRTSVDLPEPDGPQMTMRSPGDTCKSMSRSAWYWPYHLLMPTRRAIALSFPDVETAVSYTHLRAHETPEHLVCRLLLEKK